MKIRSLLTYPSIKKQSRKLGKKARKERKGKKWRGTETFFFYRALFFLVL